MSEETTIFVRRATGLRREYGPFFAIAMPLNTIVGIWIALYTPIAAAFYPGANIPLATFLCFIPTVIECLGLVFLAVSMPRAGGTYVWPTRAFNPVYGISTVVGVSVVLTFIAVGLTGLLAPTFIGLFLIMAGIATGNFGWISVGEYLATNLGVQIAIGVLVIVIFMIIDMLGPRVVKWFNYAFFICSWVGTVVMLGVLAAVPKASIPTLWDATWGEGAWNEIIGIANTCGWGPAYTTFNFSDTLNAMILLYWCYVGMSILGDVAGEVSAPEKSFMTGFVGGACLVGAYFCSFNYLLFAKFGEFVKQYSLAQLAGPPDMFVINPYFGEGTLSVVFPLAATTNNALRMIILVSQMSWLLAIFPALLPAVSREIFALSFDRFFPKKFTTVSARFHSPYYCSLLLGLTSIACVFVSAYAGWIAMAAGGMSLFGLACFVRGISNLYVPYFRSDIWRRGYPWTIGGVPTQAIVGLFEAIVPGFCMMFLTASLMSPLSVWVNAIALAIGIALYIVYAEKNRRAGLDVSRIFYEIPPE